MTIFTQQDFTVKMQGTKTFAIVDNNGTCIFATTKESAAKRKLKSVLGFYGIESNWK